VRTYFDILYTFYNTGISLITNISITLKISQLKYKNNKEIKEEIPTGINSEWDIQNGDRLHA
jgi:hypothetical protein